MGAIMNKHGAEVCDDSCSQTHLSTSHIQHPLSQTRTVLTSADPTGVSLITLTK